MKKSIFSYDTAQNCTLCRYNEGTGEIRCTKGSAQQPCEWFCYDVFKRTPKKSPRLHTFEKKEFEL
ncbi:MAG: hypothetical protein IJG23_05680 [Clostridia bacterium]|nr:hypothetical protein [Clostridia bacterium]